MTDKKLNKILKIIKFSSGNNYIYVLFLMIISSFLEMISLSLLIPVLNSFFDDKLYNIFLSHNLNEILNINSKNEFIVILLVILILVYLIKFLFVVFVSYIQNSFVMNTYKVISIKLFNNYLNNDYLFHIKNNSSILIRNLKEEVNRFVFNVVQRISYIVLDFLILIFIFTLLLFYEFKVTMIMFSLISIFGLSYYFFIRKFIIKYGNERITNDKIYFQNLTESLSGIKEVKLMGLEKYFINTISIVVSKLSIIFRNFNVLQLLPRQIIDLLIVISFISFLLLMYNISYEFDKILVLLGLYGIAALRMIPIVSRIIISLQQYSFNQPSINIIYDEISKIRKVREQSPIKTLEQENVDKKDSNQFKNFRIINFNKITFSYPDNDKLILKDLNFIINKGEKIGIFGDSGSGKSTFADIITGLLQPNSGEILIDGSKLVNAKDIKNWSNAISYCQQNSYLLDSTIKQNIILDNKFDINKFSRITESFLLKEFINSLKEKDESFVGERGVKLSGGQRQRISLARALYRDPSLLILDETTNALDKKNEKNIINNLFNYFQDLTIILITHNESLIKLTDKIYELKNNTVKLIN